jgi:hypothetical protein
MGRPERHDVDYFPFFVKSGKTLDFLELKYGPEGTGYFTNILRFLSQTPDHYYCIKEETEKMVFLSRIKTTDEKKAFDIIEIMIKTGKLDKELWEKHRVIASEDFLKSLEPAYEKRNNEVITIDEIRAKFIKGGINTVTDTGNSEKSNFSDVLGGNNPQSKVKESKVNKSISSGDSGESHKAKRTPLREREPANDLEKVEKVYLQNWDTLYSQNKVKTPDPVINWNQTRSLLKKHFEKLKPDIIIKAINNGMTNDFIMSGGYSLGTMLAATVLNRLINVGSNVKVGTNSKKNLSGLNSTFN